LFTPKRKEESMRFGRILVPLDGSQLAETVLPYVLDLAGKLNAAVTLLHVETPALAEESGPEPGYLDRMSATLGERGVRAEGAIVSGYPAREISRQAQQGGYDLIAISTHGRSGPKRWLHGSVADEVLHSVNVPLLLFRPPNTLDEGLDPETPLRHLIVPLDGSSLAEEALPTARFLASHAGMAVNLMQVVPFMAKTFRGYEDAYFDPKVEEELETNAKRYLEGVKTRLAGESIEAASLMVRGHPATRIIEHAQETEGSLVVMCTHGRTGMGRWLLGSVAERLIRESQRPVLLIRPEAVRIENQE